MAGAGNTCEMCLGEANFWIGQCPATATDPTELFEIPAVETITETIELQAGTDRRHSTSDGEFISVCATNNITRTFTVVSEGCIEGGFYPQCFANTGDRIAFAAFSHKNGTAGSGQWCAGTARVVLPAKVMDNNSTDPVLWTWNFSSILDYTSGVLNEDGTDGTCFANAPNAANVDLDGISFDFTTGAVTLTPA